MSMANKLKQRQDVPDPGKGITAATPLPPACGNQTGIRWLLTVGGRKSVVDGGRQVKRSKVVGLVERITEYDRETGFNAPKT